MVQPINSLESIGTEVAQALPAEDHPTRRVAACRIASQSIRGRGHVRPYYAAVEQLGPDRLPLLIMAAKAPRVTGFTAFFDDWILGQIADQAVGGGRCAEVLHDAVCNIDIKATWIQQEVAVHSTGFDAGPRSPNAPPPPAPSTPTAPPRPPEWAAAPGIWSTSLFSPSSEADTEPAEPRRARPQFGCRSPTRLAPAPVVLGRPVARNALYHLQMHTLRQIGHEFPGRPARRIDTAAQLVDLGTSIRNGRTALSAVAFMVSLMIVSSPVASASEHRVMHARVNSPSLDQILVSSRFDDLPIREY